MFKRFALALLLMLFAVSAGAARYTDVYYDVMEQGWGAFLIQSDTFQFIAFFIYGPDGKPTWYTAQLTDDGTGKYTGTLYMITGTYFANPWQGYNINPAGTATFAPTDVYHAMLTYTVNGVGTITKSMQRQTLTPEKLAGNYSGSMSGSISACADPSTDDPAFRARYGLGVVTGGDESEATTRTVTLTFTFVDMAHSGMVCTFTGPLTHFGSLYQLSDVSSTAACTGPGLDGKARPTSTDSFHTTGQGIEGKISAQLGGGCVGSFHFLAVLNVN
jgi:hypothetical protein